jgi:hypothetical protein
MANILISDFSLAEMPHGGSEVGNQVLIDEFDLDFVKSTNIKGFSKDDFYVVSNISLMNPKIVSEIKNYNYIIFECDYKICQSRHPWRYPNNIVPKQDRTNYDLYKNAKAVFLKSLGHLKMFQLNEVEGNFINMRTNIWSEQDLKDLETLYYETKDKNGLHGVYNTNNWTKNTKGVVKYCQDNNLPFGFFENTGDRYNFLKNMAQFSKLVFLPYAKESYCRIVVEAKCLGLDVITQGGYGVTMEDYFHLKGKEMINYLRMGNKINIKKIKKYIN